MINDPEDPSVDEDEDAPSEDTIEPEDDEIVPGPLFPDKMPELAARSKAPGLGANGVRLQVPAVDTYTARQIADTTTHFPGGQSAFEGWANKYHGIRPNERRSKEQWETLLLQFAKRLIMGHRRRR